MSLPTASQSGFFQRYRNELGLLVAIVCVVLFTTFINDSYRDYPRQNAEAILRDIALLGIFALGAGTVIIAGGIDLSSGSVIAFSGMTFCSVCLLLAPVEGSQPQTDSLPVWILITAFLVTMFAAFLVGSFHAWLITAIELPPFVATLASLVGLRSLAKLLIQDVTQIAYHSNAGKSTIGISDPIFNDLGNVWWIPVLIFAALAVCLWVLLSKTVVGRHLYALGGNEQAARLSGIRTERLKWLAYCTGSMTAAVAGILYTSYVGTSEPTRDGAGYELNAIAASVVGGCSLTGGVGSIAGIVLGSVFLKVVIDSVAKSFESRPDLVEGLVVGMLVVLAVAFNELRGSRGFKKQFFPGNLGLLNVMILTLLAGVITFATSSPAFKVRNGLIAGGAALLLLGLRAVMERRATRQVAGTRS
ncbi:ABC transporter permease [Planctomicrobium sp. SH661]|uniref:ABC transporter permease n=1 Tax=Planctomicrobium sp. SH661 TaxID=3448124 RepID=UPI003F5B45EA